MAATPVDDHTEEFEQLAGLSALRVLDGDDLERFERHAAQCERCQVMVRLDREALRQISLVAPEMDPSPDFKARLMQRAAAELAAAPSVAPREPIQLRPRPANVVSFWRRSPWASALAALLVVGLITLGTITYQNEPIAVVELQGSAAGSATVIVRRSGAAELELRGLPDPGPGLIYEAWIIPRGQQPVAAGTTARGEGKVPLPGEVRGTTVAITVERTRVDAPTSPPIKAGEVQT